MERVKILGIACSPRHGNTEIMVKEALKGAEELPGVECEFITLAGRDIAPCKADYLCALKGTPEKPCVTFTDGLDEVLIKMQWADGLIIGTPVYFSGVSAQLKCLMDRAMSLEWCGIRNGGGFRMANKVAGALAVAMRRNMGLETCLLDVNIWVLHNGMIPVGMAVHAVGVGAAAGGRPSGSMLGATGVLHPELVPPTPYDWKAEEQVLKKTLGGPKSGILEDEGGMEACRVLGRRVAEITTVVKLGFSRLEKEERDPTYPAEA